VAVLWARASRPVRRPGLTVALVGPDGAGKSAVSSALQHVDLPRPVKVIYMGVNLEVSSLMLPTTRLILIVKRLRGRRADLVASPVRDVEPAQEAGGVSARDGSRGRQGSVKESVRLALWMLEEWHRQGVATYHALRGSIVVFDRHFFADYYHADVHAGPVARSAARRLHGWMLRRGYPKPDLMIMLDAPAEQMHERKPEATVEWLERRREQYRQLAGVVPAFEVLDAGRPLEAVVADAAELIRTSWKARA
jgi:thymidylate kinase